MEGAGAGGSGSGSGLSRSPFGVSPPDVTTPPLTLDGITDSQQVEAASPISSRPPAPSSFNYDDLIRLGGDDADRTAAAGNRWPRQETLALLKIRSDMDSAFRDATLKGPLWEEVSRKLGEVGYSRSGKKCKEKFENVQKYYKRTKESRGGRQDGKTYKFFTQLEALHNATAAAAASTTPNVVAVSLSLPTPVPFGISNPTPISSLKIPPTTATASSSGTPVGVGVFAPPAAGVSISSNSSSSSTGSEEDDEDDEGFDVVDLEGEPSTSRKRRRGSSGRRRHRMMMGFFENLMKEVMQKQEVMQQKFLEAIEKREQDRIAREETWKRQEMARLSREQERVAQDRTISASRDAAIIAFLQKFTAQTLQLPQPPLNFPSPSAPQQQHHDLPLPTPMPVPSPAPQALLQMEHYEHGGDGSSSEPISSRWPKPEVLALIKIRGGLEPRYQESGPKGPLWEEISARMQRMGYNRSAKRCKEKWENINKYFKKVKDSNKKRRHDSKTCPYFHELDALYRSKIISTPDADVAAASTTKHDHVDMEIAPSPPILPVPQSQPHNTATAVLSASLFGESTEEPAAAPAPAPAPAPTKPEDIVNELMELQELYSDHHHHPQRPQFEPQPGSNRDEEEDDDNDDDYCSGGNENVPEGKSNNMDYKIEFQRRNVGNSNGVGSEFPSMAVVQ